jgi:hypothetical protein
MMKFIVAIVAFVAAMPPLAHGRASDDLPAIAAAFEKFCGAPGRGNKDPCQMGTMQMRNALIRLGYCHGKRGQSVEQATWHTCARNSLGNPGHLVDIDEGPTWIRGAAKGINTVITISESISEACRGIGADDAAVCDIGNNLDLALMKRGYCYGKVSAELRWHRCTRGSYRGRGGRI